MFCPFSPNCIQNYCFQTLLRTLLFDKTLLSWSQGRRPLWPARAAPATRPPSSLGGGLAFQSALHLVTSPTPLALDCTGDKPPRASSLCKLRLKWTDWPTLVRPQTRSFRLMSTKLWSSTLSVSALSFLYPTFFCSIIPLIINKNYTNLYWTMH